MSDRLWEKNIRFVEPYTPGEQPEDKNVIKLNTNENPYGVSPEMIKAAESFDYDLFRRYPDPTAKELVSALADYYDLKPENVFVGVGSDDVLGMCFMTFFNSDKPILFPDITYSFYPVWSEMLRIPYETKALKEDFTIDIKDYLVQNGGIVIPNPNAPTSILLEKNSIREILDNNKESIVIIDEAYIDFAEEGSSVLDLIGEYDNLIVVRTYSKSRSLAGLRIGYAMADSRLIKYLNDVKYSYNSYTMNYPSIKLGSSVRSDDEYFKASVGKIKAPREGFSHELTSLGFTVLKSSANFVFASPADGTAEKIFEEAKKRGIYFRYFKSPRIDDYLRITIGKDDEMKKVIEFLKDFLTK